MLARKHVTFVVVKEIDQPAGTHRNVLTSQADPRTCPVKHLLLFRRPSIRSCGKAGGKVSTIVGIVLSLHRDLFTVIELRNSAHTQDESSVKHYACGRCAL